MQFTLRLTIPRGFRLVLKVFKDGTVLESNLAGNRKPLS